MSLKKTITGAVAVLATLAVAGCGSASDLSTDQGASLTKQNFASSMVSATSQAKSVHMTGAFTVQGQKITMTADESMKGTSLKDLAVALNMTIGSMGAVEVRVVAGVVYVNGAKLGLPGTTSKPWLKVDLTDKSNPLGAAFSKIASMNPSELMKAFQSISTLTEVGTESVDGVQATHYTVTVDTSKATSMLGMPMQGQMSSMPKTLTYDVWVDAASQPVKVMMNNPMFTVEVHFSKWGEPVHVVAPPASQVSQFGF